VSPDFWTTVLTSLSSSTLTIVPAGARQQVGTACLCVGFASAGGARATKSAIWMQGPDKDSPKCFIEIASWRPSPPSLPNPAEAYTAPRRWIKRRAGDSFGARALAFDGEHHPDA
jgi:hypothetical protein